MTHIVYNQFTRRGAACDVCRFPVGRQLARSLATATAPLRQQTAALSAAAAAEDRREIEWLVDLDWADLVNVNELRIEFDLFSY